MIRAFKKDDLDAVMQLWLASNIRAHAFVAESYWRENYEAVKEMLPDADVFVYENDGVICGFVGLTDNYIAGIFVDESCCGKGIGKALLNFVKQRYHALTLRVYEKNARAVQFYLREGFAVSNRQTDENTGEVELEMNWKKIT